MVFVAIEHETYGDGTLAVSETQNLVFLDAVAPDAPLAQQGPGEGNFDASDWDDHREFRPDEPLLFRYSALTFNSHRIHYDLPYACEVERYRGLVVHGPLTASLLLQLAARTLGENRLAQFRFRGISPAIVGEPLHLVTRERDGELELGAFTDDGAK